MRASIFVTDDLRFHLCNGQVSYIFEVSPEGIVEHCHFGGAVSEIEQLPIKTRRLYRACSLFFQDVPNYNLNDVAQEYPVFGSSDHRHPAIHIVNDEGNSTHVFRYQSHQVLDAKADVDGLPSAHGGDKDESASLMIVLKDEQAQVSVELYYTIYAEHDVISRSAKVINHGCKSVVLKGVMSSCLDLPVVDYDVLHLTGSWGRELHENRFALPKGRFVIDSANGTSGNAHNPFIAIMERSCSERQGNALSLIHI